MKRLILLACLLLVAGPVGALAGGDWLYSCQPTDKGHQCMLSDKQFKRMTQGDPPCLARMEEVLKVIEPWLGYTYKDDTSYADFKKARALFYVVKKDCWSKP